MQGFIWLDRVKDNSEIAELIVKAKAENHGVFLPTHTIKKDGELVGYFSIGSPGYPVVFAWLGDVLTARDSFSLINNVENHLALAGSSGCCFPVPRSSPFHALMENMGFKQAGEYTFYVKKLQ